MDRKSYIIEKLDQNAEVKVKDLAKELNCSEPTIRADLRKMEQEGILMRVHGGARLAQSVNLLDNFLDFPGLQERIEEKRAIARKAYEFINERDTIFIDDSSTAYFLAECIRNMPYKNLVVITNSVASSLILSGLSYVNVIQIGGMIGGRLPASMGEETVNQVLKVHADKAFIGVYSLNFEKGITSIGDPQMQVKKAILQVSKKTYCLVDHTKFDGGYLSVVCPLSDIECIITDTGISQEDKEKAAKHQVKMIIA